METAKRAAAVTAVRKFADRHPLGSRAHGARMQTLSAPAIAGEGAKAAFGRRTLRKERRREASAMA